jgi:hypothetical protein
MAATDDKTNFYVDTATGSNDNGGSSETLIHNAGNVDATVVSGSVYTLDDLNNTGWGGAGIVNNDDILCYDTAGDHLFAIVTDTAVGGDVDIIEVDFIVSGPTDLTDVNVNVGGPWATMDYPCDMIDNDWVNATGDPITIWVKNGSYNELATIDNGGAAALPITLEGYNTTEGDGWDYDWTGNLPTIDGSDSSDYGIRSSIGGATFWALRHLNVINSTGSGLIGDQTSDYIEIEHCRCSGNALWGIQADNFILAFGCEFSDNGSGGFDIDSPGAVVYCEVFGNGGDGIHIAQAGSIIANVVHDNVGRNIFSGGLNAVLFNTVDGNYDGGKTLSVGYEVFTSVPQVLFAFNMIHNCNVAIDGHSTATAFAMSRYNQWDNNNSANVNWITGQGDIEDGAGAPGFIDEASNNYQPTAVSPANGAAGPTTSPSGNTTTNRAVGAAEPATATGGGVAHLAGNGGGLVG